MCPIISTRGQISNQENMMKSFVAIVLCMALTIAVFASDGGYKVTYDGGSVQA
jgi:hypothetical protein